MSNPTVERDRKIMPVKLSPSLLSGRDKGSVTKIIQEVAVNSKQEKKMVSALNQIVSLINAAGSKGKGSTLLFQVRDIAVGSLMGE
jgi:hypothetical protein